MHSFIPCSLSLRVYDEGPPFTVSDDSSILNRVCVLGKTLYIPLMNLRKTPSAWFI